MNDSTYYHSLSIDQLLENIRREAKAIDVEVDVGVPVAKLDVQELLRRLSSVGKAELEGKLNYHKYEFYRYNDIDFVKNAARVILGREVRDDEMDNHVKSLRLTGDMDHILKQMVDSDEGRRRGVLIYGLKDFYCPQEYEKEVIIPLSGSLSKYHFLMFEGEEFVRAAYWGVLKRHPDETGMRNSLLDLGRGVSKEDILISLLRSEEGRQKGVNITDLWFDRSLYYIDRAPIAGRVFRYFTRLLRRVGPGVKFQKFIQVSYAYGPLVKFQKHQDYWLKKVTAEQYQIQLEVRTLVEALLEKEVKRKISGTDAKNGSN